MGLDAGVVYRDTPAFEGGRIEVPATAIGGGCDSGALTIRGAALATVLAVTAIGVALVTGQGPTTYTPPHAAPAPDR